MTWIPLLFRQELRDRIMSTMTFDYNKILAATGEELIEVAKVCMKGIRKGVVNTSEVWDSEWFCKWREELVEETAHAMVMLTAIIERFKIDNWALEEAAKEVCMRYEE